MKLGQVDHNLANMSRLQDKLGGPFLQLRDDAHAIDDSNGIHPLGGFEQAQIRSFASR